MISSPVLAKIKALADAPIVYEPEALRIKLEHSEARISVSGDNFQPESVVGLDIGADGAFSVWLSQKISPSFGELLPLRITPVLTLIDAYLANPDKTRTGFVHMNIGDHTVCPGLTFCSADKSSFLIPDSIFLETYGYEAYKTKVDQLALPWEQRLPAAIWRGATTGPYVSDWRDLPRVRLCAIAAENPDLIDAGISWLVQGFEGRKAELEDAGYMRDYMSAEQFCRWKYQIDIDGNTNSWPGLFQKLLSGSPVIKVGTPYRQWYYDRLIPWENYVPCREDMSDLVAQINWLREHDDEAREIGRRGRELALSMTYENEMRMAAPIISDALAAQMTYGRIFEPTYSQERLYTSHGSILTFDPESRQCQQTSAMLLKRAAPVMPLIVTSTEGGLRLVTLDGDRVQAINADGYTYLESADATGENEVCVEIVETADQQSYAFKVGEKYLCAESDGRLTVSRVSVGPWEIFSQKAMGEQVRA
ncbi:glycosyl transferase family 90 [Asticcacaulis sp. EMRT-3]|uniref:glycosyl transferase family 90 n=1 Tax=Asticcacaulis sp. EMRT-3 TaxID=3040349 RepID=UPI0024AFE9F5|nr:glycosyl transferase family 90 [Asticcacaulis sp. EMRT-3]MDI7776351.1 glycosyl transferase family 90 [Asticcacaulis sp. EMRT-3]